jgi:hypothetical protein
MAINETFYENKEQIVQFENSKKLDDYIFNIRVYNEGEVL